MAKEIRTKNSFGSCDYVLSSPAADKFAAVGKAVNIKLTFEDALKLNLAIQEAVRKLNSYNRATMDGRRQGLNLCVYFDKPRITVTEVALPKSSISR